MEFSQNLGEKVFLRWIKIFRNMMLLFMLFKLALRVKYMRNSLSNLT